MAMNRKFIREHTPNIPWIRRILTRIRIKAYEDDLINWNIVQSCIQKPQKKAETIEHYCRKWPERTKLVKKEASEFGIDSSMFQDVLFANFAYGMRAEEFMYYDFANKTELERSTFLSDKKYSEFTVRMNNLFDADTFIIRQTLMN